MRTKGSYSKNRGFVLVTVIIFGGILMTGGILALRSAKMILEESMITAERLRIENAAAQASALAGEWFRLNIKHMDKENYFALSAAPAAALDLDFPAAFFEIMEEEYPDYNFSCRTLDLHYSDENTAAADLLRVPRIPPGGTAENAVERAYIQKVTVTPIDNKNAAYTHTKSLRAIKEASGDIRCVVVGVTD